MRAKQISRIYKGIPAPTVPTDYLAGKLSVDGIQKKIEAQTIILRKEAERATMNLPTGWDRFRPLNLDEEYKHLRFYFGREPADSKALLVYVEILGLMLLFLTLTYKKAPLKTPYRIAQ